MIRNISGIRTVLRLSDWIRALSAPGQCMLRAVHEAGFTAEPSPRRLLRGIKPVASLIKVAPAQDCKTILHNHSCSQQPYISPSSSQQLHRQLCSLASLQSPSLPRPSCLLQSQSQSQPPPLLPRLHPSSSSDRTWGASSNLSVRRNARCREYLVLNLGYPPVSDGASIWNDVSGAAGSIATYVTSAFEDSIHVSGGVTL